jgi:hypothetical protein
MHLIVKICDSYKSKFIIYRVKEQNTLQTLIKEYYTLWSLIKNTMFYTYIVTTVNLTAVISLSLNLIASLFLLSFCLHCCCFTDEIFNKWWHCDLTHYTCHTDEVNASLMQSLISCSSVVVLKVLKHFLIVSVSSLIIHKTLKWLRNCTDCQMLK